MTSRLPCLFLAIALSALVAVPAIADSAVPAQGQTPTTLLIDAGIQGNSAGAVGAIENCVRVNDGDEFQVDVVVRDVVDLLAWELYIAYDPAVVQLVGQDVKLFQQANGGSVVDLSAPVPDDSGFHSLAAFDSSDPPTPDSGTGVLGRVTLLAVAEGESAVGFGTADLNDDGTIDRGTLLRNAAAGPIGDVNGDVFFDGETQGAIVAVGQKCPPGSLVASQPEILDRNESTSPWLAVSAIAVGASLAAIVVALLLGRRGGRRRPDGG